MSILKVYSAYARSNGSEMLYVHRFRTCLKRTLSVTPLRFLAVNKRTLDELNQLQNRHYTYRNLVPLQAWDLLEKLMLSLLYNFQR